MDMLMFSTLEAMYSNRHSSLLDLLYSGRQTRGNNNWSQSSQSQSSFLVSIATFVKAKFTTFQQKVRHIFFFSLRKLCPNGFQICILFTSSFPLQINAIILIIATQFFTKLFCYFPHKHFFIFLLEFLFQRRYFHPETMLKNHTFLHMGQNG